jgi:hypothetical protein
MNATRSRWLPMPRLHALVLFVTIALGLIACVAHFKKGLGDGSVPQQGWRKSRGPVIPHDSFPKDCSLCHVSTGWREIRKDFSFDHEKETGVALVGAHATAECLRCHNDRGPVSTFSQRGCVGCHDDVHRGKLGTDCQDCHTQTDWSPNEQVTRHNRTRFPLIGAHAAVGCFRCHPGAQAGTFDRTDPNCIACHRSDLARATNPDHRTQGWVDDCQRCHIPTSWTGAGFNHSGFPLTGAHRALACAACHLGGIFSGLSRACVSCHQTDYDGTNNPPHSAAGFPTSCQFCHNTRTWQGATFNHSGFPLTGGHAGLACAQCHSSGVYVGLPTACVSCHQTDYNNTTNPNHTAAGFPTTCQTCHNTTTWLGATFNHTWFPITSGHHSGFTCAQCHPNPANFSTFTCTNCHLQAQTDSHHQGVPGYSYNSQACYSCHPHPSGG